MVGPLITTLRRALSFVRLAFELIYTPLFSFVAPTPAPLRASVHYLLSIRPLASSSFETVLLKFKAGNTLLFLSLVVSLFVEIKRQLAGSPPVCSEPTAGIELSRALITSVSTPYVPPSRLPTRLFQLVTFALPPIKVLIAIWRVETLICLWR